MKKLILLFSFVIIISLVLSVSCVNKEVPVTETYYETEYRTEYKTETYTTTEDVVVETVEGSKLLSIERQWRTSWVYLSGSHSDLTYYYGYDISTQEHSTSHVQVSFNLQPQLHKGIIAVVDLTGACYDQSIPYPDVLFGGLRLTVNEGCQVDQPTLKVAPMSVTGVGLPDEYIRRWLDGFNALIGNPARILAKLSVDKATTDDRITFDAEGIKAFAIVISVEPEIKPQNVRLTWSDDVIERQTVTKERQVPYEVPVQVEKQRTVMQMKKVPFWEVWKGKRMAETPSTSTETSPAPPIPSTPKLSFEAAEYTNTEYGFSVKYPKEWEKGTALVTGVTPLFVAAALTSPVGVPALIVEVTEGATFKDALTAVAEKLSAGSAEYNIFPETTTILADGTMGWQAVINGIVQGMPFGSFCLGATKDDKWVVVEVLTITTIAPYNEAMFSEIAHTLQFK